MKKIYYTDPQPVLINNDVAKGVAGRVLIGKADGADNFCMRVFEIDPGGNTPKHSHDWEHEIFFHTGEGEVFGNGSWSSVTTGDVVFVPSNEEHQIRNIGTSKLTFICVVPSKAPEM
jgi:quercetin dioxygenase-like cupin family protein